MALEALRAAEALSQEGIEAEVIDVRTLRPLDERLILRSVANTGRFIVADTGWRTGGFGSEVVARVTEEAWKALKCPPQRVALPDCPTPTSPGLARYFYPQAEDILQTARKMMGNPQEKLEGRGVPSEPLDIPHSNFAGPF
jgi:pyruvate dehydrogenase E1 component beta subunit